MTGTKASPARRRASAAESFRSAADCIGPIVPGLSLFAITRGQFSMIDAVLHTIDQLGPCHLSAWTWTIADYEVECVERLIVDQRLLSARLIIEAGAAKKPQSKALLLRWIDRYGPESVRFVANHAKIATVWTNETAREECSECYGQGRLPIRSSGAWDDGICPECFGSGDRGNHRRVLLRGSMNLNFNPRFEQLDVTEGGPDFNLVREVENELPILSIDATAQDVAKASKLSRGNDVARMAIFEGAKTWGK